VKWLYLQQEASKPVPELGGSQGVVQGAEQHVNQQAGLRLFCWATSCSG